MPRNDRHTYRDELNRAIGNIDWCMEHLRRMAEAYREHHEEVSETCELFAVGLYQIQEGIARLKEMI